MWLCAFVAKITCIVGRYDEALAGSRYVLCPVSSYLQGGPSNLFTTILAGATMLSLITVTDAVSFYLSLDFKAASTTTFVPFTLTSVSWPATMLVGTLRVFSTIFFPR
jgi:hypothetical protein